MSLENDAMAGAGLTPAAERIRHFLAAADAIGATSINLDVPFARNLADLIEQARDKLEATGDSA